MGCFLGCFGLTKKKRRKSVHRILPGDHRHGSYEVLDSSASNDVDIGDRNPICFDSELSGRVKVRSSIKIRKKVSFNLNVQIYEPLPKEETSCHLDDDNKEEKMRNERDAGVSGLDSCKIKNGSFPSNHRYHNCVENFEDGDEIESDLDYYDEDDDEDEDDEFSSGDEFDEDATQKESLEQVSIDESEEKPARDRRQQVPSVLNPVENLSQWKAMKAKTAPIKHLRKENIELEQETSVPFASKTSSNLHPSILVSKQNQSKPPLLQEIAVDASLSNWLASPEFKKSKAMSIIVNCNENIPPMRSMFDKTCSRQSREQRPISDLTNLEA